MNRPVVDLGGCTLCLSCVAVCPDVFSLNDAGFIQIAEQDVYPQACIQEAIKYCPENVIYWEED